MSLATFIKKETAPIGNQPIQQEPAPFTEVLSKNFRSFADNYKTTSRSNLIEDQKSKRAKLFEEIEGGKLDPMRASNYKPFEEPSAQAVLELGPIHISNMRRRHDEKYIEEYIAELKQKEPEKYKNIQTKDELEEEARKAARLSKAEAAQATARSSGISGVSGSILGGIGAAATDPINIAALPFGAARGAGVMRTVLIEAGANAAAELATQPFVSKWQKELGEEYGFKEVVENVGFAALFGGSVAGVFKGAKPSAMFVFDKMSSIKGLKPSEKLAASYMSKVAHLKEAIPFIRGKTPLNTKNHYESIKAASTAFEEGKRLEPQDIKISEADFKTIDARIRDGDTDIQKVRLQEIERFQRVVEVDTSLIQTIDLETQTLITKSLNLDEKRIKIDVARKNRDVELNKLKEFDANKQNLFNSLLAEKEYPANVIVGLENRIEEIKADRILKRESVTRGKSGKRLRLFDEETDRLIKQAEDELSDVRVFNKPEAIKEVNREISSQRRKLTSALKKKESILKAAEDELSPIKIKEAKKTSAKKTEELKSKGDDDFSDSFMDEILREFDSPEVKKTEDINFRALAEENPDLLISLEDGEYRIGELLEQFDNDDNFIKQITTCTIG